MQTKCGERKLRLLSMRITDIFNDRLIIAKSLKRFPAILSFHQEKKYKILLEKAKKLKEEHTKYQNEIDLLCEIESWLQYCEEKE